MEKFFKGFALSAFLVLTASAAFAATVVEQVSTSARAGDFTGVQTAVESNPAAIDDIVKSLLGVTLDTITQKPEVSGKSITLAAGLAPRISPASVPAICAEVRHIVTALPPESVGSPLFASVRSAAEAFAKAPVVVAAGRPKLCEEAWVEASDLDAELAQQNMNMPPNVPPFIIKPSGE